MKRSYRVLIMFGLLLSMVLIQASNNPVKAVPTTNNTWVYSTGVEMTHTAISENGQYIVAVSNNIVYLFHRSSPIPLWNYTTGDEVYSVDLSADGQYIVAGIGNTTYLFHKSSSAPLWANETGGAGLANAAISADGQYIIAGGNAYEAHGLLYYFHRNSSIPLWTFDVGGIAMGWAQLLDISAHGETSVVGCGGLGKLMAFTADGTMNEGHPLGGGSVITAVGVSEDGLYIIGGDWDGMVWSYNKAGGEARAIQMGGKINSVAMSKRVGAFNRPYFVVGDDTGNFSLGRVGSSLEIMWSCILPSTPTFDVTNVAISKDGNYFAATNGFAMVTPQVFTFHMPSPWNVASLWNYTLTDFATPDPIYESNGLAMSADGRYVATGTLDGNLYFCDLFDSDGDDLADGYEEDTSPTDPYLSDTDGDGLNDSAELFLYPTNATDPDTDDDGLTDGAEILTYFTNATNPDTDGDGYSDGAEVAAGSDPLDPASIPSEGIPGFELAFALLAGVVILFQHRFRKKPNLFAGSEFFEKEFYSDCLQRF